MDPRFNGLALLTRPAANREPDGPLDLLRLGGPRFNGLAVLTRPTTNPEQHGSVHPLWLTAPRLDGRHNLIELVFSSINRWNIASFTPF